MNQMPSGLVSRVIWRMRLKFKSMPILLKILFYLMLTAFVWIVYNKIAFGTGIPTNEQRFEHQEKERRLRK